MKHLNKFNELKSYTYKKASDKLKTMGHPRRAGVMKDWAIETENREREAARNEEFKRNGPYGVFDLDIMTSKWDPNTKKSNHHSLISGKFVLSISYQSDWTIDSFCDNVADDFKYGFNLIFEFGVMPADEETRFKFDKLKDWQDDFMSNGAYWCSRIYYNVIPSTGGMIINPTGSYSFDSMENDWIEFKDRANAIKFKKLFSDAIAGKNNWGTSRWTPLSLGDQVKPFFTKNPSSRLSQEDFDNMMEGGYEKLVESTKRMSVNQLYKN